MKKIAIIGAGLSGLALGQKISKKAEVFLFEKARGVGGRMSTRYAEPFTFDHGAQYWTAQTEEFQNFLAPLLNSVVAEWKGPMISLEKGKSAIKTTLASSCFVAVPHMNSLCKHLAKDLTIETQCEVTSILDTHNKWRVMGRDERDLGVYDLVISTAPAPQTLKLFSHYLPSDHKIHEAKFDSCFSLMVGVNKPWDKDWIAANIYNSPIKWIGVNSTKPSRNHDVTCLVIHSDPKWTEDHLHKDIREVEELLLKELSSLIALNIVNFSYVSTHRWTYSRSQPLENAKYYLDLNLGLCALGDWCETSNIEEIWLQAGRIGDFLFSKM